VSEPGVGGRSTLCFRFHTTTGRYVNKTIEYWTYHVPGHKCSCMMWGGPTSRDHRSVCDIAHACPT
jgi:hypothetical protein